ncbi:phospholipase [Parazoarcus communis]|uniref:Phospholipase A1 n=1 Tax=Parazoarcus communis TaxID=41977 RepID=A0A2U8GZK3_9RHOO|nr:phospholipase A [Parazoarcus communis]AWI79149.1 phospholipase [Parazoarcus communis]
MKVARFSRALLVGSSLLALSGAVRSQGVGDCVGIENGNQRLACYDRKVGRSAPEGALKSAIKSMPESEQQRPFGSTAQGVTLLDSRWELSPETKHPVFTLQPYKPIYFMPVFHSTKVNEAPCSAAGGRSCVTNPVNLDSTEGKYQLSFKTKLVTGLFDGKGDIWAAYTQSSRWQVYNGDISRPFRETNYEPEILMTYAMDYDFFGWKASMVGFGLNHQSNGRADPLSRSWNRIPAFVALQKDDWVVAVQAWHRIKEEAGEDDNPDIEDYVGRGELLINRRLGDHNFALTLRHSLRFSEKTNHGSGMFEWTFPISGYLKGYMQIFSGYGESLIDYNFRKNAIGLGISLVDW